MWDEESPRIRGIKYLLFLISPFFSMLYSLRTLNTRSSYIVLFLFCIFFGMSFSVGTHQTETSTDGISYRVLFEEYQHSSSIEYQHRLSEYFQFDNGGKDIYFDTVAFYLSRVTSNYHVMFMVFALVFAFFQLKSLTFLTHHPYFDASWICLFLAFLFSFNQIYNINGMRFWTAAWIGVYALFQVILSGNKRYFALVLITPLFHGSYFFFILATVVALLLKRLEKTWIVLYVISFFVSNIALELIISTTDILPPFLVKMINPYVDESYIALRNAEGTGFWWVQRLFEFISKLYINILTILLILNRGELTEEQDKDLFRFTLAYISIVNFFMGVPSVGGRFIIIAYSFLAYLWLVTFRKEKYNFMLQCLPLAFFMNIFYLLRDYITVLDISFYLSNPVILIFNYLI